MGSDASSLPCWDVVHAPHSFLEIWHQDPEGFLPRVGVGWRKRPSFSAKGTKSQEWEVFETVFGIREPSRLAQVCGVDTEVPLERQVGRAQDRRPVEALEVSYGFCLVRAVAGVRKMPGRR